MKKSQVKAIENDEHRRMLMSVIEDNDYFTFVTDFMVNHPV